MLGLENAFKKSVDLTSYVSTHVIYKLCTSQEEDWHLDPNFEAVETP